MSEPRPAIRYDRETDALAITLSARPVARTFDLHDGRLIDLDPDGHAVAIEVLGASAGFRLIDLAERYGFLDQLRDLETELHRVAFAHAPGPAQ